MIVLLLNYSISWCQNDTILPTGELEQDSVLIPISALRIANAKMIELKYEKDINENLRQVVINDSAIINALENNILACIYEKEQQEVDYEKELAIVKRQRNTAIGIGSGSSAVLLTILLLILL